MKTDRPSGFQRQRPRTSFWTVVPTVIATLTVASSAAAQVNIEAVRKQLDTSTFGGRLQFSLAAYAGNTQGLIAGIAGIVGGRIGSNLGFATGSADYTRLNHTTSVQKSFAHLRHSYEFTDVVSWEEFAQSETDRFRRIQFRGLLGTGPRFAILRSSKWLDLFAGVSYMLEYTSTDAGAETLEPSLAHRLNQYVAVTIRPDDRVTFSLVTYYQPRFDAFSDAHVLNVTSVLFKVTQLLTSRIDVTTRYESVVPEGVERADLEFKSSVELTF